MNANACVDSSGGRTAVRKVSKASNKKVNESHWDRHRFDRLPTQCSNQPGPVLLSCQWTQHRTIQQRPATSSPQQQHKSFGGHWQCLRAIVTVSIGPLWQSDSIIYYSENWKNPPLLFFFSSGREFRLRVDQKIVSHRLFLSVGLLSPWQWQRRRWRHNSYDTMVIITPLPSGFFRCCAPLQCPASIYDRPGPHCVNRSLRRSQVVRQLRDVEYFTAFFLKNFQVNGKWPLTWGHVHTELDPMRPYLTQ